MSMNAMAVLRIDFDALADGLGAGEEPASAKRTPEGAKWLASAYGGAILVHRLSDGVLLDLGHAVGDVEPEQLGAALRAHLGMWLERHEDERGIFVFPERARPEQDSVDAIIAEVAELGEWVEPPQPAGMPDMGALASMMGTGSGATGMPAGLEDMMGQMLGGMDSEQMAGLWEQAQAMMADPEKQQQMMQAAAQMLGGNLDMDAIAKQAEQLAQDDPELMARLKQQLPSGGDDED